MSETGCKKPIDCDLGTLMCGQYVLRVNSRVYCSDCTDKFMKLQKENEELKKKLFLYGSAQCENLHHARKYQGHKTGYCPIELYLNDEITLEEFNMYKKEQSK